MKNRISLLAFVISGFFLMSVFLPSHVWAQTSASSEYGDFSVDKEVYFVERGKTTFAQLSGTGEMTDVRPPYDVEKVFITTRTGNHQIFSTEKGYFSLPIPLTDEDLGMHKVHVAFGSKVLGVIYFEVKTQEYVSSAYTGSSSIQQSTLPSITAITNNEIYEKGDSVRITGTVDQVEVITLQVTDPKNNIIRIDQVTPSSDGKYSVILNTNGPLWKFEGDYNARVNGEKSGKTEVMFYVSIPKVVTSVPITVPTSPAKTTLTLNILPESQSQVRLSGTLTANFIPVSNAFIDIIKADSKSKIITVQTKNDGAFSILYPLNSETPGDSYKIQAVFGGSSKYESSKSAQYMMNVESIQNPIPTSPPSPPSPPSPQPAATPAFDPNGVIALVVVIIIIGIIVAIAKRRKKTAIPRASYKPKRQPPKPTIQSPPQTAIIVVEGPKKTHRFACPNCFEILKRDFVKQTCAYCGWHS